MSNPYKKLGGQALIYGLGNIVPRILNYAVLTVYYTRRFPPQDYGIITELYAYVAILLVILTYGMETGLFKFSRDGSRKEIVYSTILTSVIVTSSLFVFFTFFLRETISVWIGYDGNPEYVAYLGIILSLDAVCSIVFAKLRIENKVRKFALIKILNVITTIVFVFFFLEVLPRINTITGSNWYSRFFADIGVGYVFIANMISSFIVLLVLFSDIKSIKLSLNKKLLFPILAYSLPLLVSGLAGIFNETIDRILLRRLTIDSSNALYELGIYGANYRIAVLLTIFVQMFRYAAEPFFFNWYGRKDSKEVYANILKYFTVFMMVIFLGVALCIDFFKLFIDSGYHEGLGIVPIVLMSNVIIGLLFNVNMWYKLSGHTLYGVYITGAGAIISIILNIIFIPVYGYYACAWIHLISNGFMLAITYYLGQKHYKIGYDVKRIALYIGLGIVLYGAGILLKTENGVINSIVGIIIVLIYFLLCNSKENLTGIFFNKNESQNS